MIEVEAGRVRRRRIWMGVALVGLAGIVIASVFALKPKEPSLAQRYRQVQIERGTLIRSIAANGRLEARSTVEVGAEISGRIAKVLVKHDETVTMGQVLAVFDTESLKAQVKQAEASVRVAKASLKKAQVDKRHAKALAKRSASLHSKGVESDVGFEEAHTGVQRAEVAVESAAAQLALQRASRALALATLKDAQIRSPIAGTVIRRDIDPGQTVVASFQTPTLFVIAEDMAKMQVTASVDEADIGEIAVGQMAKFTVNAYPSREFQAQVSQVRSAAKVVQNVATYEAILEVENQDFALKPGMTASVHIETGRVEDEFVVPTAALRFTPPDWENQRVHYNDQKHLSAKTQNDKHERVWVAIDNELRSIHVEALLADDTRSAVIGDQLKSGQSLVIGLTPEGKRALEKSKKP